MVVEEAVVAAGNEMSLSNMVLGFYEEAELQSSPPGDCAAAAGDDDDGSDDEGSGGAAKCRAFWKEQQSQLYEALAKMSSAESRIQADAEEAMRQMRAAAAGACSCASRGAAAAAAGSGGCRSCTLRFLAERLRDAGYNSAICRSKWPRSPEIPSGEHSYVDVVAPTRSGKAVRVVVEPSFRGEFEMARGGAGYRALVASLPEAFVGRADRLRGVVRVMCAAAKQCARESGMHMAPWRKQRYMEAKWLATPERVAPPGNAGGAGDAVAVGSPSSPLSPGMTNRQMQPKFRASMLTLDFGGRTAVEVV
ncbi:uncharacterized protein [Oryza sativa Japonica Group]|uniref:Os05g0519300 protein n=2 Tax=Oryza sativa subsp. japonica TaxID=39947 RepID=Q65X09_ORYSJ|nr:uncharacterized protein LOC4339339 [Oryza sativa Japonica Group]AAU44260.1 unknown protein [Oryza sativa Japonica Group]KAF2931670.1 hypothetical protein DAI22_05g229100 [Oryza sativa Japonica Group]BAF17976.1 Os05g0519300 [Oryza sativa Japonica Group]BAG98988.1 unnamed protein product [Oryza sativa Japonica Group]BAS94916.1 Os05g0519300 [Oryza sativa Japonica Group]|eukprot:NP_001056062.1 Os05g0519300 [Oryza sativa Japonica Group]